MKRLASIILLGSSLLLAVTQAFAQPSNTELRGAEDVDGITINGSIDVTIKINDAHSAEMQITGSQAARKDILTQTNDGILSIVLRQPALATHTERVKIGLTLPHLSSVEGTNHAVITLHPIEAPNLTISLGNHTQMTASELSLKQLTLAIDNHSQANLAGMVNQINVTSNNHSVINAVNLSVQTASLLQDNHSNSTLRANDIRLDLANHSNTKLLGTAKKISGEIKDHSNLIYNKEAETTAFLKTDASSTG